MEHCGGPGYPTPLDAMKKGPKEKLLYVVCVQPDSSKGNDFLATVDIDPKSKTFCQIIHKLHTLHANDELHHSGWNTCSSAFHCKNLKRDKLILPALGSGNIYIVDVSQETQPKIHKKISSADMANLDCGTPHTSHCLPSGEIMISTMGDKNDNGKGEFVLIDTKTFEMKGTWTKGSKLAKFGYDFWYQPKFDTLASSEWGTPKIFKRGFQPSDVIGEEHYGRSLNFFSYKNRTLKQTINLGEDGIAPLEVRFLHDPNQNQGFVGCAVNANVFRFWQDKNCDEYKAEKVISIPPVEVTNFALPKLNGLVTDILLSLDDKYLYLSCWLQGDVRQYDISDPAHPKLTGQVYIGGLLTKDSNVKVTKTHDVFPVEPVTVKGKRLHGAPQMLQLSLDGKRLYVSCSLFSPWDKQFYKDMVGQGSWIIKFDVDHENGGMTLDKEFLVDFGPGNDGPCLAHEMRYPGGDCTSDIWLSEEK